MPIVQYSDSESEAESAARNTHGDSKQRSTTSITARRKRKLEGLESEVVRAKAPPLPSAFHSLYTTNVRSSVNDDPALHGGRQRQVPHIQGNWPSHIYLEWIPTGRDMMLLDDYIDQAESDTAQDSPESTTSKIYPSFKSDLEVSLPLHISLSAPLALRSDHKDAFVECLKKSLQALSVPVFEVKFRRLDWVSNRDKTRHFLVLSLIQSEQRELDSLLEYCNCTCQQFGQPTLYEDLDNGNLVRFPRDHSELGQSKGQSCEHVSSDGIRFHITIAWTLREPSLQAKLAIEAISLEELQINKLHFDTIKVKVGNVVTDIMLKIE